MSQVFSFVDDARTAFWEARARETAQLLDPETGKVFSRLTRRVDCPICGVDDAAPVFVKEGFDFVKCRRCGLLYVNPQLKPGLVDEAYKDTLTATAWIAMQQGGREMEWNRSRKYVPALERLKKLKPEGGRLLDIGCSTGQFMVLARDYGWEGQGIELNHEAAATARREYGLTVHERKLEELEPVPGGFDLISMWGVLEHLPDPAAFLKQVHPFLGPGGLLLTFVPNSHSLIIRLSREHNSTVSGPFHIWYFSPRTMGLLLEAAGLAKADEFTILPQIHEIVHFLQYNTLYQEAETAGEEEFLPDEADIRVFEDYINRNKLGYKLITIAQKAV